MADIEKVKQGLRCCFADNCLSKACPYGMENDNDCLERLAFDALSVIEEQQEEIERLKPKREGRWIPYMPEYGDMFQCDECEYIVRLAFKPQDKKCPYGYCPKCGKQMELS